MLTSQAFGYGHTVMIRGVRVTPAWMPYASTDGWTSAVPVKESNKLKYFEIAIWDEISSIHLYEFPNNYDASYGGGKTDQEKIAYREQFCLRSFSGIPNQKDEKSWQEAKQIFEDTIISSPDFAPVYRELAQTKLKLVGKDDLAA